MSRKCTKTQEKQIEEMCLEGKSLTELGVLFQVNMVTIRNILKRRGIDRRSRGGVPLEMSEEAKKILNETWTTKKPIREIAEQLGIGGVTVRRWAKHLGLPQRKRFPTGEAHAGWKGGIIKTDQGYVMENVPDTSLYSSMRNLEGYIGQHRLVMAKSLGRCLTRNETVHHIDGDRQNNDISNLQLRQKQHGAGVRHVCLDCGSENVGPAPLT